ncbi:gamma-glutamyltransferase [Chelatococcus sp. SYSU_G07232]|uniref:Gamma-glutamyltransferase n=1 Tax=Chelatococcus albus TaxID=3047466 RepID=A0ABT7AG37_9HYPH|nr:gamma-glutamyltransferase [Chelatococcus sp. SYSU_G07232]MDJ1158342.1 gamma-glutamyltransferase [Chelatococcus sp. SYSU_G07232]
MLDTPTFSSAAVAAPHPLVAETGRNLLAAGANALEAALGMAATSAVVLPHLNGLGGDAFFVVRAASGRAWVIDAAGPAGALATADRYRAMGYEALPRRGGHAALTVAAAVAGWAVALDLARHLGGRMPLDMLLAEALQHARTGVAVPPDLEAAARVDLAALGEAPGFAETFLNGEKPPAVRRSLTQPALAAVIDHLAHAGLADFHRGDVGRELAVDLERFGAPVTRRDLETCRAEAREAEAAALDGATLHVARSRRGMVLASTAGLRDRLAPRAARDAVGIHALVEARKRALRAAAEAEVPAPLAGLDLDRLAARITAEGVGAPPPAVPFPASGVFIAAADMAGNVVGLSQSLGAPFGSGCVLPCTGMLWQGWAGAFSLHSLAAEHLRPGRAPDVLDAAVVAWDDGRVTACGASADRGDVVVQLIAALRTGDEPAAVLAAPRWCLRPDAAGETVILAVEEAADPSVVRALRRAGHAVEQGDTTVPPFGCGGLVLRHARGRVEAAHDPRGTGTAAGL